MAFTGGHIISREFYHENLGNSNGVAGVIEYVDEREDENRLGPDATIPKRR